MTIPEKPKQYVAFLSVLSFKTSLFDPEGCPRCVMVKAVDCGIVISEFEL